MKVRRFVGFVLGLHQLMLSRSSISCVMRSVMRLFELPEPTVTQYLVLPKLICNFVGVVNSSVRGDEVYPMILTESSCFFCFGI